MATKRTIVAGLIMSIQTLLIVWGIRVHVATRLELREARNLIVGLYRRDTNTRGLLRDGADAEYLLRRLSTNQHFVARYAIRRNVMRSDMFREMEFDHRLGRLDLNEDQLRRLEEYSAKCREWERGDDYVEILGHTPIAYQIEEILYNRWKDRVELWKTWKPNDLETNIELVSPWKK